MHRRLSAFPQECLDGDAGKEEDKEKRGGGETDEMRARTQACTHARTLTLEAAFPFKKSHPTQIRRAHAGSAAAEGEHC